MAPGAQASFLEQSFGGKFNGRMLGGEFGLGVNEPFVSLFSDLRKRYAVQEVQENEAELYFLMLRNAFVPGYISTQVQGYPMLVLTSELKRNEPGLYDNFTNQYTGLNALDVVSSNYTDPVAFSLFLGEIMNFRKQVAGKPPQEGYGMMGYVVTYGPWSAFNNRMIRDDWLELKWKIRGMKRYDGNLRTWNLLLGFHHHENPLFPDALVLEAARSLKTPKRRITLLENNEFRVKLSVAPGLNIATFLTKQSFAFSYSVFFPATTWLHLSMTIGLRRELINRPSGALESNYEYYLLPSVSF